MIRGAIVAESLRAGAEIEAVPLTLRKARAGRCWRRRAAAAVDARVVRGADADAGRLADQLSDALTVRRPRTRPLTLFVGRQI